MVLAPLRRRLDGAKDPQGKDTQIDSGRRVLAELADGAEGEHPATRG